jgi:RimJ/RimL family protein N-acetyltransferase
VTIDRPREADYPEWRRLYQGYAEFYRVPMDDAIARRLWGWLHDPEHVMEAFVARDEGGRPIGLAHFRAMPRPLAAGYLGFLDDLFVDPAARGQGFADQLIAATAEVAGRHGAPVVTWLTAPDNHRAQKVYDRVGGKSEPFLEYELELDS